MVKNLPAMQETWVQSLGQEDPLEKGDANHSSILAWRIPWTEEPGGLQSMELQRVTHTYTHTRMHARKQYNFPKRGVSLSLSPLIVLHISLIYTSNCIALSLFICLSY